MSSMSETRHGAKVTTKTIHQIDAFDLDAIVAEELNLPEHYTFEFVAEQEASNGSSYEFRNLKRADFGGALTEVQNWIERIKERDRYNSAPLHDILAVLVGTHALPEGDYMVKVYW